MMSDDRTTVRTVALDNLGARKMVDHLESSNVYDTVHLEAQRKHFDPKLSEPENYRAEKRYISAFDAITIPSEVHGLKHFGPMKHEYFPTGEKVHFQCHLASTQLENILEDNDQMGTKHISIDENQIRRCLKPANEISVEKMMGRKRRVFDLQERNCIPYVKPGDKNYANPEHSIDFYKTDRYMPNSEFDRKSHTTNRLRLSSLSVSGNNTIRGTLYKDKVKKAEQDDSIYSVVSLDKWEIDTGYKLEGPELKLEPIQEQGGAANKGKAAAKGKPTKPPPPKKK